MVSSRSTSPAKTFFLTGFGRSGTKFVAHVANKADGWTVRHEAGGEKDRIAGPKGARTASSRIARCASKLGNYGEVSWLLYPVAHAIEANVRGVLLRNHRDIATSWRHHAQVRNDPNSFRAFLDRAHGACATLDALIQAGWKPYSFNTITSSTIALGWLLDDMGVKYDPTEQDIEIKINSHPDPHFKWEQLSASVRAWIDSSMGWFSKKYALIQAKR